MATEITPEENERSLIQASRRIVVKVGTNSLVTKSGHPDPARFEQLVHQLAILHDEGREVVLVTSAAIAAGLASLKLSRRPTDIPGQQSCAAVGQPILMRIYSEFFAARGKTIAQILLSRDDLQNRRRHVNARLAIDSLLGMKAIPIINENDAVAVDEIKFGDNDILAALVAVLIDADLLLLLSTTDGLKDSAPGAKRIRFSPSISEELLSHARGKGSELSTGGMKSKLESCRIALGSGIPAVIADGRNDQSVLEVMKGSDTGTLLGRPSSRQLKRLGRKKRWLAYFKLPAGSLVLDEGAVKALRVDKRSLLAVGIHSFEGKFEAGSLVNVLDREMTLIGRGLCSRSSAELQKEIGLKARGAAPVIHRDNLIVFIP